MTFYLPILLLYNLKQHHIKMVYYFLKKMFQKIYLNNLNLLLYVNIYLNYIFFFFYAKSIIIHFTYVLHVYLFHDLIHLIFFIFYILLVLLLLSLFYHLFYVLLMLNIFYSLKIYNLLYHLNLPLINNYL